MSAIMKSLNLTKPNGEIMILPSDRNNAQRNVLKNKSKGQNRITKNVDIRIKANPEYKPF